MPKLLLLAPCLKAIVATDNTLSLITLLEHVNVDVPEGSELAPNATSTMQWNVAALWIREDGDEGKRFEQRIWIEWPDGRKYPDIVQTLDFRQGVINIRSLVNAGRFPLVDAGTAYLRLSLREEGEGDWRDISEFRITITRGKKAEDQSTFSSSSG